MLQELSSLQGMQRLVLHLPILTTLCSIFFCAVLIRRYRQKGGGKHLWWWGVGMATYGVGTATESFTTLLGWNETVFRVWYIAGAFLGGYPLAQGSIYLLGSPRFARWSARIVCTAIAIGAVLVFLSPLDVAVAEPHRLSGKVLGWQWLRAMSPFINLYSVAFLAGGAWLSALRYRREPSLRDRYVGNILIAIGAILPGIGGSFTRFGVVEMLYITELAGLLMIFLGYRRCVSAPAPQLINKQRAAFATAATIALVTLFMALPAQAQSSSSPAPAATADATTADQQPQDTDGDGTIDSFFSAVTVTATGNPRDTFEVATPVTVIQQEEIARLAPDNAADLLRTQPGVDVNGVGPNQSRPVIRGQRGLRVLFLEDGLRLNNARRQTDFGEVTGLIDLQSVGSVEVVRGPASVLYGSDAIGGVLNLVPSTPRLAEGQNLGGGFELRYGSAASTKRGSVLLEGASGDFDFQFGASRRESDAYDAPKGTFGDVKLTSSATVNDTGLEDNNLWGTLGWKINENNALRLRLSRYRADQTGFGFVEPGLIGEDTSFRIRILYPYQNFDRAVLGYTGSNLESAMADRVEAKLYWQSNERQLVNEIAINIGPVGPGFPDSSVNSDTKNFTNLDTVGFRLEAMKVIRSKDVLTYGLEGFRDDSVNTDFSKTVTTIRFPFPPFEAVDVSTDSIANAPNATNTSWGAFVQNEVKPIDKLQLTAGLRYQKVTTKAEATPNLDTDGLDFNDSKVVGAVTATWLFIPELNAFVSYGRAFRAPSIIERLFNGPTPEGAGFQLTNPGLQSEDSKNWDVGIKYRRNNAFLEAVLFRTDIDGGIVQYFYNQTEKDALPQATKDQIELLGDLEDVNVVQERNVDKLRYEGVEVALGYRFDVGMTVGGNYTHLNADRLDSSNPPTGDTYGDKYVGYVRWEPGTRRYWVEYRLRHNSSTPANLDPNQSVPPIGSTLPGFTVHALAGGVTLFEKGSVKHELDLSVENLTDELYAEFSNASFFRPEPGRNVKAAYRLRF